MSSATSIRVHSLEARPPPRHAELVISEEIAEEEGRHEDIYRGEPPDPVSVSPQLQVRPPSLNSAHPSSSSSSSSGWSVLGLRRGALGAVLEKAINRWARATSGSSTSSSSSSSSVSSIHTRAPRRRRPRRPSIASSTHNLHSENIIRARLKARGEGRTLPREFTLFLPKELAQYNIRTRRHHRLNQQQQEYPAIIEEKDEPIFTPYQDKAQRNFQSTSLPLTLTRLDAARKRSAKLLRKQGRSSSPGYPLYNGTRTDDPNVIVNDKGKGREVSKAHNDNSDNHRIMNAGDKGLGSKVSLGPKPAWWLDVSSPTWSDMREIGKMLHLHPLTLEDILHQETREKLEFFPRLGYYFIVFRALESDRTRAKATQLSLSLSVNSDGRSKVPISKGTVGATNVYIAVFRDGICTFHFEDIGDHTLRVRNRIMQLEGTFNMTSDWIAHGLLDSIVDQFFPLLNTIEREVKELDDLILSIESSSNELPSKTDSEVAVVAPEFKKKRKGEQVSEGELEKARDAKEYCHDDAAEKILSRTQSSSCGKQSGFGPVSKNSFSFSWLGRLSSRLLSPSDMLQKLSQKLWKRGSARDASLGHHAQHVPSSLDALLGEVNNTSSPSPLMRMAATRKLVTSLTRLLGTKGEVVSRIRKRLAGAGLAAVYHGEGAAENGLDAPAIVHAAAEVGIYLDDIQDHIQTLHQALAHYERILSHSHPAYLSYLRLSLSQARGGADKAFFLLSAISVGIVSTQMVTGLFSMNFGKIPRNRHPGGRYTVFGIVVVAVAVVALLVIALTRWWWVLAGKKFKRGRTERGF